MKGRAWLITAVIITALVVGHPLYLSLFTRGVNPLTVSEFYGEGESVYDQRLRVEGTVATGSVNWDDETRVLRFILTDGSRELNIYYQGIAPDTFRPGNDMTLEGRYGADSVFRAANLDSSRPICTLCH